MPLYCVGFLCFVIIVDLCEMRQIYVKKSGFSVFGGDFCGFFSLRKVFYSSLCGISKPFSSQSQMEKCHLFVNLKVSSF